MRKCHHRPEGKGRRYGNRQCDEVREGDVVEDGGRHLNDLNRLI